jgi:hypothetical protein
VTDSRCFVRDRIYRALPIALAIGQVIASGIGQGTAAAIVSGIVAAIGRPRRIVPKAVAIAPKPAAEIVPRPPIVPAAPRAEIAEAVAAAR